MASWTTDSELDPVNPFPPPAPRWAPDWRAIMVSVAISVPLTIAVLYAFLRLAFHFCWGCGGI